MSIKNGQLCQQHKFGCKETFHQSGIMQLTNLQEEPIMKKMTDYCIHFLLQVALTGSCAGWRMEEVLPVPTVELLWFGSHSLVQCSPPNCLKPGSYFDQDQLMVAPCLFCPCGAVFIHYNFAHADAVLQSYLMRATDTQARSCGVMRLSEFKHLWKVKFKVQSKEAKETRVTELIEQTSSNIYRKGVMQTIQHVSFVGKGWMLAEVFIAKKDWVQAMEVCQQHKLLCEEDMKMTSLINL
ncbi:hypothetical protein BC830DRAFT_1196989 [Chytriomyces sp. MP71]|nr:hypothetical protein BC830DRAFT_1196989 [Chytriomyces sp. MP71]